MKAKIQNKKHVFLNRAVCIILILQGLLCGQSYPAFCEPETVIGEDKVWAVDDALYIRTSKAGSIVRIYSLDGVLREQQTIVSPGVTTKKLSRGIYVVTVNNNIGRKVVLTD